MSHVINWFEIPSTDFERAVNFYSTVLGTPLQKGEFLGTPHGFLQNGTGDINGAVIPNTETASVSSGPLIYLGVGDMDAIVDRVAAAGGKVVLPKTSIGDQGSIAVILDSEGNRVGLHMPG